MTTSFTYPNIFSDSHSCLFRIVEEGINEKRTSCCPICGWATRESYAEKYDERKGKLPQTEKEKNSLKWEQYYILDNPVCHSGYKCYERLKNWKEKK